MTLANAHAPTNSPTNTSTITLDHYYYGQRWLHCDGAPALLFTHNETNKARLFGVDNDSPFVKDGIALLIPQV